MDPKWSHSVSKHVLLTGFTLCVVLVTQPMSAIDIRADTEVVVENGTTAVLRCSFKSIEVVSKEVSVTWSFQSNQPDAQSSKDPSTILYLANGKTYPGLIEFKHRVSFIGDVNKRDVSIQLSPVQFSDNGTYFCDVKNPPDVEGRRARIELRVVLKAESNKNAVIIGAVIGAVVLLILIVVAACLVMRMLHNRHDYEGCTSLESVSSQAPQPRKKVESSLEVSRCSSSSGPLQGPVIYAQLDHSGSKNSFHKMEPVVYADIRKN